jgi:DNA-binding PadR family transcriptional regulator
MCRLGKDCQAGRLAGTRDRSRKLSAIVSSDKLSSVSYKVNSRNLWALTVLCLLREGPLHPYQMQQLVRQRRKDRLLDLHRGSLYNTIGQLQRAGLIEEAETSRQGRRPERTVYQLTPAGETRVTGWLREILAIPADEPSSFLAAVAFLGRLTPRDAQHALESRAAALEADLAAADEALQQQAVASHPVLSALDPMVVRLLLLDADYVRTMHRAELTWVKSLLAELRTGSLAWDFGDIIRQVRMASKRAPASQPGAGRPSDPMATTT